jgi:hypothetical protein
MRRPSTARELMGVEMLAALEEGARKVRTFRSFLLKTLQHKGEMPVWVDNAANLADPV